MPTLPTNLFSPTFKQQKLGLLFSAIMGIMVYLATLAMALQLAISMTGVNWNESQENHMTIEIPLAEDGTVVPEAKEKQLLALIANIPQVQEARLVSDAETSKLLEPWVSDPQLLKTLPLPSLIDVQIKKGNVLDAKSLKAILRTSVPEVQVDAHADWLVQLHQLVRALTALGWLLLLLTGFSLVIAVSLICRAAMAVEQRTLDLLHIMGATDHVIAASFARHAFYLAWPSALLGFTFGLVTVTVLAFLLRYFMLSAAAVSSGGWFLPALGLSVVPVLAVLGAVAAARYSVLRILRPGR